MRKINRTINQITLASKTLKRGRYFANGNVRRIRRRVLPVSVIWLFSAVILGFLFLSPELFAPASAETTHVAIASTGNNSYVSITNATELAFTVTPASSGTTLYNSSDTSSYLSPASGTISTPAVLGNNQWGFAIPSSVTSLTTGTFSSSYTTPIPDENTLWAYIPTMNDASYSGKVQQTNSANTEGVTTPFYIGAKIDNNLSAGTATISPTTAGPGDTVTITTTTYSALDVSSDQISVSIGGYTCQNPVANTSTGTLIITCTLPTNIPTGTYNGSSIIVSVAKFGMTYTVSDNLTITDGTSLQNSATPLTMQNVTPSMCNNTPLYSVSGETYWLVDSRDGNYYGIRKLADNKCWMVTNLKLAGGTTISSADSNLTSGSYKLPNSSTSGFDSDTGQFMYNGNDTTGAYYSYLTATAGTGASVTSDGGQASGSICPKNWRLPTGNATTGEFTKLYQAYSSNKTNLDAAWSPVYVGYYDGSTLYDSGTYADWWSSTSVSSTSAVVC